MRAKLAAVTRRAEAAEAERDEARRNYDSACTNYAAQVDKLVAERDEFAAQRDRALACEARLRDVIKKWRSLPRDPRWGTADGFRMLQEYERAAEAALSASLESALREHDAKVRAAALEEAAKMLDAEAAKLYATAEHESDDESEGAEAFAEGHAFAAADVRARWPRCAMASDDYARGWRTAIEAVAKMLERPEWQHYAACGTNAALVAAVRNLKPENIAAPAAVDGAKVDNTRGPNDPERKWHEVLPNGYQCACGLRFGTRRMAENHVASKRAAQPERGATWGDTEMDRRAKAAAAGDFDGDVPAQPERGATERAAYLGGPFCGRCGKQLTRGPIGGGHFDWLECTCGTGRARGGAGR